MKKKTNLYEEGINILIKEIKISKTAQWFCHNWDCDHMEIYYELQTCPECEQEFDLLEEENPNETPN